MKSQNGDLFIYNAYWRTWSRVLRPMSDKHDQVEVDLTTPNGDIESEWEAVRSIHIRKHCTSPRHGDKLEEELPDGVVKHLRRNVDEATLRRLLHEDFLPQIDWDKYRKVDNGGASLSQISKD